MEHNSAQCGFIPNNIVARCERMRWPLRLCSALQESDTAVAMPCIYVKTQKTIANMVLYRQRDFVNDQTKFYNCLSIRITSHCDLRFLAIMQYIFFGFKMFEETSQLGHFCPPRRAILLPARFASASEPALAFDLTIIYAFLTHRRLRFVFQIYNNRKPSDMIYHCAKFHYRRFFHLWKNTGWRYISSLSLH